MHRGVASQACLRVGLVERERLLSDCQGIASRAIPSHAGQCQAPGHAEPCQVQSSAGQGPGSRPGRWAPGHAKRGPWRRFPGGHGLHTYHFPPPGGGGGLRQVRGVRQVSALRQVTKLHATALGQNKCLGWGSKTSQRIYGMIESLFPALVGGLKQSQGLAF